MYETSSGFRVLTGSEKQLFCLASSILADFIYAIDDLPGSLTGVDMFDRMTKTQKLCMLNLVTTALLDPDVPSPILTAIIEATIGAIYKSFAICIDVEKDFDIEQTLRGKLLLACGRFGTDYNRAIEDLMDRILQDRDYELSKIQDVHPDMAKAIKMHMGIDDDYFVDVAPDNGNNSLLYMAIKERCGK